MFEHWSNSFRKLWTVTLGPIGIIANGLLVLIILKHTPDSVKTYSTMIMVMTVSEWIHAFCSVVTSARMIPTGSQLFFVFQGFCEKFLEEKLAKSRFCMFWYSIQVDMTLLNQIIMVFSYIYRGFIITMPFDTSSNKMVKMITFGYSILHVFYLTWVYFMSWSTSEKMDEAISKLYPDLVGSNYTYSGILDLNAPSQIVMNYFSIIIPWVVILAAVICRWKIWRYLRKFQFSDGTRLQHKSLLNVLLYQTIGPVLYTITVILYVTVGQRANATALLENLMTLPTVLMGVISPIVTIIFITPYRIAFLKSCETIFGPIFLISFGSQPNVRQSNSNTFSVPVVN